MTTGPDDWIDNVPALSPEQIEQRLATSIRTLRIEMGTPPLAEALVEAIRPLWEGRVSWDRVLELASHEA